jgi:BRO family, N-terminal domain
MTVQSLAQFNGQSLSIIDHAGHKWITAREVGQALGYKQEEASRSINNLYERHKDEFEASDTCVIKLTTQGQAREVRVFSATGCNTLGFFSGTKTAKAFRNWAKKVLAGQAPDAAELARVQAELLKYQREKFEANPVWVAIADLRAAGRDGAFIAKVMGLTRFQQEHAVKAIRRAGLGHFLPASALPPVGKPKAPAADTRQMNLEV